MSIFLYPRILLPGPLTVRCWTNLPGCNWFQKVPPILWKKPCYCLCHQTMLKMTFMDANGSVELSFSQESPGVARRVKVMKDHLGTWSSLSSYQNELLCLVSICNSCDYFFQSLILFRRTFWRIPACAKGQTGAPSFLVAWFFWFSPTNPVPFLRFVASSMPLLKCNTKKKQLLAAILISLFSSRMVLSLY